MPEVEHGYTVCRNGKVVALVHSHPSGSHSLSVQDIKAARQHNVRICVKARGKTKCYKLK